MGKQVQVLETVPPYSKMGKGHIDNIYIFVYVFKVFINTSKKKKGKKGKIEDSFKSRLTIKDLVVLFFQGFI